MIIRWLLLILWMPGLALRIAAQDAAYIPGLKTYSYTHSYKNRYDDSVMTSRRSIYDYDREGRMTAFIQLKNSDTTECWRRVYDSKGRLTKTERHWNLSQTSPYDQDGNYLYQLQDSACSFTYDDHGSLQGYHAREYRQSDRTDSLGNPILSVTQTIFKVSFDPQHHPVLERKTSFEMIGNDTVFSEKNIDNVILNTYNEKDSLVSMKRKNHGEHNYSLQEKIQYGPHGRISWQRWGYGLDSLAAGREYDAKGRITVQKFNWFRYDTNGKKIKKAQVISYFYNESDELVRRETLENKEKKVEYLRNGRQDSVVFFEDGKRRIPLPPSPPDPIPAVAQEDNYNEIWKDGARLEFDQAGRLVLLIFTLDGIFNHIEYGWEGDRLASRRYKDYDGNVKEEKSYRYEFY